MAKRQTDSSSGGNRAFGRPRVPDLHLWDEVAETVSPLATRRRRRMVRPDDEPLPLPESPPPPKGAPKRLAPAPPIPSYRSDGRPSRPPGHGIEPNLHKRLQRGRIDIDGTLDLHGMRQHEAHAALNRYVRARAGRGDRTILVITGKGLKKAGPDAATIIEAGVLRTMLPMWLSEPALSSLIAGWEPAARVHGGQGAFYVRLRSPDRGSR